MIINSEQEMLNFGKKFAQELTSDWNIAFRDRTKSKSNTALTKRSASTGNFAGGTPAARRREPSTVGETAKSGPVEAIVVELIGDVGAGKTTFTRGLAEGLGIKEQITSPSFTISKSYALPNSTGRLIHYDFYRLPDPGLMLDDLRENLETPENIIIVEWGESVADILPENHLKIAIMYNEDGSRTINLQS